MIKKVIILALLPGIVSCSTSLGGGGVVCPNLIPYFQKFQAIIGVDTYGIDGQIVPLVSDDALGLCEIKILDSGNEKRIVSIDTFYWSKASDESKTMAVFHELGHCAMGLVHIPEVNIHDCPISLMFPQDFSRTNCFTQNEAEYYQELISLKK